VSPPPVKEPTFEEALAELERIVHRLEDGQIDLEGSLASYETGVALLKRCYGQLQQAEQRILLLTGVGEDERPVTQPFAHTSSAAVEKVEPKRRKRTVEEPPERLF
jgi:exodeoxyribonuclease VII small subunit